MVEKVAARASILIPRALAGDPVAIALLAMAGITIVAKAVKENA